MKKTLFLFFTVLFIFSIGGTANAANPLKLNVNGAVQDELPSPLVRKNVSYVPIRTAQSLGYKVTWNSRSKTVLVVDPHTSDTLSLAVGSGAARINEKKLELDTPPFVEKNTVYVPLRFMSGSFGTLVHWDSKNNGIVIISPNPEIQKELNSGDLAKARLAVIGLPRVQFYYSTVHPEGPMTSFIYTENDYSKWYFLHSDSIYYYELKNGYMSLVWEGQMSAKTQENSSSPLAKFLGTGIDTLWGEQPKLTSRLIYFEDRIFPYDEGEYGIIGADGSVEFSHKVVNPKQLSDIIVNFKEENQ
ncbi:copper amine oxidase N-terminal domain-containing protein [Paenibacillus sp. sgz500992]|uniref:copper amine oxidase N-terminal domain-containing protein n=1 Tax=Paenibacillus sp. sgz500992 TaxID=3242476 RepID=UPI0036D40276